MTIEHNILMTEPRHIPPMHALLAEPITQWMIGQYGRASVVDALRQQLDVTRQALAKNGSDGVYAQTLLQTLQTVSERLESAFAPSLRPVINATGVILHTNLGRAPLAQSALEAIRQVAGGYSNLEYDLDSGQRGKRQTHIEALVAEVIGAEAAMVVNNNAAAVLLTLSALGQGRDAIISRGQLVEIGGGFRMPDVMAQSGVKLVEVGTTNRTRLADYENAITEHTALLMQAHTSNFRIMGFTESTPLADLAGLAHARGIVCVDDLGSGALLDTAQFGLHHEPTVQESLAAGADVVLFSGDKLLGGPQAGIIVGRGVVLDRLKKHPLARALRVDKLTIAALTATLDHYRRESALQHIPIWRMMAMPLAEIESVVRHWIQLFGGDCLAGESTVGGGSLPGETLSTVLYAPPIQHAQAAQDALRHMPQPIIARIADDRLLLDPRTIQPHERATVENALSQLMEA